MDSTSAPSRFEKPTPVAAACRNAAATAVAAGVVVMVVFLFMRPPLVCPEGNVAWTRLIGIGLLAGVVAYFGPDIWNMAQSAFARSSS